MKNLRIIADIRLPEEFFEGCYQHWYSEGYDPDDYDSFELYCYEQMRNYIMSFSPVRFSSIEEKMLEAFNNTGGIDYINE